MRERSVLSSFRVHEGRTRPVVAGLTVVTVVGLLTTAGSTTSGAATPQTTSAAPASPPAAPPAWPLGTVRQPVPGSAS